MKTLQLFLLVMLFVSAGTVSASTTPKKSFTQEVYSLLENLPLELEDETLVTVVITFNKNNEIVVLSDDARDYRVSNIIKKRLNYKKVNSVLDDSITEYKLPIRFK